LINSSYARAKRDDSLDSSVIHPHTHISTVSFPHPRPSFVHASTARVQSFKNLHRGITITITARASPVVVLSRAHAPLV